MSVWRGPFGRHRQAPSPPRVVVPTPWGQPVSWARIGLATDLGDSHPHNDDRCLVVAFRDLTNTTPWPFREFVLCLLADGATGSTFDAAGGGKTERKAGWRASQLAQAIVLQSFFSSESPDVLERLMHGLWRADQTLATSEEGRLATTMTALFVSADGSAHAASIGNSALLVFPPKRPTPETRRLRKLGHLEGTAVGNGETTAESLDGVVEHWSPEPLWEQPRPILAPGTRLVLLSDGIADNLPTETVDHLTRRHPVERAVREVVHATQQRRLNERRRERASISEMGLDNMSAILVRFDGAPLDRQAPAEAPAGQLVWLRGLHGGPRPESGGPFGLVCLLDPAGTKDVLPAFLRRYLDSEHQAPVQQRLADSFLEAMGPRLDLPFAAVAAGGDGTPHHFAAGGAAVLPQVETRGTGQRHGFGRRNGKESPAAPPVALTLAGPPPTSGTATQQEAAAPALAAHGVQNG
ncbi:MAG TPA: hypothetical protein VHN78_12480, partial [Chloroflexota bacterium]|nr:hypothetical protein [Chloroflexota bacterium]